MTALTNDWTDTEHGVMMSPGDLGLMDSRMSLELSDALLSH